MKPMPFIFARSAATCPVAPAAVVLQNTFTVLKRQWPFRRPDSPGVCNYFFEDGQYPRPEVRVAEKRIPSSHFGAIFRKLDSSFPSPSDVRAAEEKIDVMLSALVNALK